MEGLLSLLVFAGVFFLLMRFGCGAHVMHGYKGSHGNGKSARQQKHVDPVCGMEVAEDQGYGKMHQNVLYRFCSRDCLDKFESHPEQYKSNIQTHEEIHHEGGIK